MGLIIIGCARLRRSYIQIKNFLNSYRAGAHSNSVTLDVSALFSVLAAEQPLPHQLGHDMPFAASSGKPAPSIFFPSDKLCRTPIRAGALAFGLSREARYRDRGREIRG
jgi:hypothetical protein